MLELDLHGLMVRDKIMNKHTKHVTTCNEVLELCCNTLQWFLNDCQTECIDKPCTTLLVHFLQYGALLILLAPELAGRK